MCAPRDCVEILVRFFFFQKKVHKFKFFFFSNTHTHQFYCMFLFSVDDVWIFDFEVLNDAHLLSFRFQTRRDNNVDDDDDRR